MYKTNDKVGTHRYAVYFDRKTKEWRAVQLTHLYEIPSNKRKHLARGYIKKYKLACYALPSGIETGYITKDVNGNALQLTSNNSRGSYNLSKKDSSKIKSIAKRRIN